MTPARLHPGGAAASLIDPQVLARIDDLELVARTVVDGFLQGLHRSPYLGLSLDFAEHRPYMPGDDIRRIDWRVWARTDRYYLKQFEAETNANCTLLVDASGSMGYGSGEVTKLDYARILAACLAYFSHRQRDRVGLLTFDDALRDHVPPAAKNFEEVLHTLHRARPAGEGERAGGGNRGGNRRGDPGGNRAGGRNPADGGERTGGGDLPALLAAAAERLSRRGLAMVISDFYAEPEAVAESLRGLAARGSDVIVFHVLDPVELELPLTESAPFEDLESGERMPVVPEEQREAYVALVREHTRALRDLLAESRIDYALLDTSKPLDEALYAYLSTRQRLSRVR